MGGRLRVACRRRPLRFFGPQGWYGVPRFVMGLPRMYCKALGMTRWGLWRQRHFCREIGRLHHTGMLSSITGASRCLRGKRRRSWLLRIYKVAESELYYRSHCIRNRSHRAVTS